MASFVSTFREKYRVRSPLRHQRSESSSPQVKAGLNSRQDRREEIFTSGDMYGLRLLYEPSAPARPLVDIIFIHGLTGNPFDTWYHSQRNIYWPIDLLSKDIPNSRIMAFGYDSDVAKFLGPVSQNTIRNHASTFLGDLAALRADDVTVSILRSSSSVDNLAGNRKSPFTWFMIMC